MAFDGSATIQRSIRVDGALFTVSSCGRFYDAAGCWFRIPPTAEWLGHVAQARDDAEAFRDECRSGGLHITEDNGS